MSKPDKTVLKDLPTEVRKIVDRNLGRDETLQNVCDLLHERVDVYDWVGFYLVDPNAERELILGPYTGAATDHTRIPFGKGICGQAAATHKTFVVEDVTAEDNYLSCSIDVKSEIVVPVMKNGEFVAELDIDSHTLAAMDETDRKILEEVCRVLAPLF